MSISSSTSSGGSPFSIDPTSTQTPASPTSSSSQSTTSDPSFPSDLMAAAQQLGGQFGPGGLQVAESILKQMLMNTLTQSNELSNDFVAAIQESNPDNDDNS